MQPKIYRFANYRLFVASRELWQESRRTSQPRVVFDCLLYLIERRDRAVGRDELVAAVWGRVDIADGQVNNVVLRARRAVGDDGQSQHAIRTVPGFGYRWVLATDEEADETARADGVAAAGEPTKPASSAPAEPTVHPRERRRVSMIAGLIAMLAVLAAGGVFWLRRAMPPPAPDAAASSALLAVLPLKVDGDRDAGWVRYGAMDLIGDRLRRSGVTVVSTESVVSAVRNETLDAAALRSVLDAGALVEGHAAQSPQGWQVELRLTGPDGVRHRVTAENADAIVAARQAADRLLASTGHAQLPEGDENDALDERIQRAQAAVLASELDVARDILDTAPDAQRNEPEWRLRSAIVDFRAGRLDQADASLSALLADPRVAAEPLQLGRTLTWRGDVRFRRTDFAAAERDYAAAVVALQPLGDGPELAKALNGRGIAEVGIDRFDDAGASLGRARLMYQQVGDRLGLAQADTNLGLLESQRGHQEAALQHLKSAAAQFEALGAVERRIAVLSAAVDTETALLRWQDALATADALWALRERAGDRGLALLIGSQRGAVLAALGRFGAASALLGELRTEYADTRFQSMRYLWALEADLAWRQRHTEDALAAAERSLAAWPDDHTDQRLWVTLIRQRAAFALGKTQYVEPRGGDDVDAAEAEPTLQLLLAEAAAVRGGDARRYYRAALAGADRRGVPSDIARVIDSYARWLLAHGENDEAAGLAGRVAAWAERDFDCALLQWQVLSARTGAAAAAQALARVRALAGERRLPEAARTLTTH